jgi:hypothetical protein
LANYEKQVQLGILSVNDVRRIHNQKPVEGGDDVFVSTNLQAVKNPIVTLDNEQVTENDEILI